MELRKSTLLELPLINPITLIQEISQRRSESERAREIKENYNLVECPYLIQAAISGSWEIFKFFQESSDINVTGHIGLSKKKKNSFTSNCFGAACYYGNIELVKNLLQIGLDINLKSHEKNAKNKSNILTKEYSGFTPLILALLGEGSDEFFIDVLKIISNSVNLKNEFDHEKNNLLHMATRLGRFKIIQTLIEEYGFNVNDVNSEVIYDY